MHCVIWIGLCALVLGACGTPDQAAMRASPSPAPPETVAPLATVGGEGHDVGEYYLWASDVIGNRADAIQELAQLLETAALNDEQWYRDVGIQLQAIERSHNELAEMPVVPAGMAMQHRELIQASQKCHDAIVYIERGVGQTDTGDLDQGVALLARCTQETQAARGFASPAPSP